MAESEKTNCESTLQLCNLARGFCQCWWESDDPEDWVKRATGRIDAVTKALPHTEGGTEDHG